MTMATTKRTIFLTGATGNMGSATLDELMARSDRFRIKALVRPEEIGHPVLKPYAGNPALEIVPGDLTRYDDVVKGVSGSDHVLHIGAMVSPMCDNLPELTMRVNVGGTGNVVAAVKAQPNADEIGLIYIGTVAQTGHRGPGVHWGRTGDPIKISRFDTYAVSKTQAEAIVASSGLKRWASLRQTGIAHARMWKLFDPIIFHNPFNGVFEWVTVGDSGRLAANTCEDGVPDSFWRGFYNIGGGAAMRLVNHEFAGIMTSAMGAGDWRQSYQPNWFATRNFHGQWYSDSDRLETLIPFRSENWDDFVRSMAGEVPLIVRLIARFAPGVGRKRLEKLARAPGGPLYWLAQNDDAHLQAYFGSRAACEALPAVWDAVKLAQPSRQPSLLDHGYDTDRPEDNWTPADLRQAAAWRGAMLASGGDGGPDEAAHWHCALGHDFAMTPRLMLRGGNWCPTCMVDPDSYDAQARANPFFAQVWPDVDCG